MAQGSFVVCFYGVGDGTQSLHTLDKHSAVKVHPQPYSTELRHQLMWGRSTCRGTQGDTGGTKWLQKAYTHGLGGLAHNCHWNQPEVIKMHPHYVDKKERCTRHKTAWEQRLQLTSYFSENNCSLLPTFSAEKEQNIYQEFWLSRINSFLLLFETRSPENHDGHDLLHRQG